MMSNLLPESLRTYIKFIDEQHATLIKAANDLIEQLKETPEKEHIEDMVTFLVKYAATHFKEEEEYMLERNYAGFEAHKKEHDYFNYYIKTVSDDLAAASDIKAISTDVAESMRDWIIEHVYKTDKAMAEFLRSC